MVKWLEMVNVNTRLPFNGSCTHSTAATNILPQFTNTVTTAARPQPHYLFYFFRRRQLFENAIPPLFFK